MELQVVVPARSQVSNETSQVVVALGEAAVGEETAAELISELQERKVRDERVVRALAGLTRTLVRMVEEMSEEEEDEAANRGWRRWLFG